jgi:bifunctional UDP-N-acetylglucosamine pyrophosphorylase/glucosamine-1-phosphate N-acetyltransferase
MSTALNNNVRAVVLAAGQGKRMKSSRPKVLHEVLGRTILARVLSALDELGLNHIYVVVGHGGEQVSQFLTSHPPATAWTAQVQEPQLGTGHALQQVAPHLSDFTGTILVTVADTPLLTAATLSALIKTHRQENATVTALTAIVDDAKNYGRIVRDWQKKVVKIVEDKDATSEEKKIREINTAIYCFDWPAIGEGLAGLTNSNQQKEYYLTDLVGWASQTSKHVAGVMAEDWREVSGVNSRLELAEAACLLRDRTIRKLALEDGVTVVDPQSTWIAPEVKIGPDTVIRPACYLTGAVQIGENCLIGPHTVMQGPVRIGDRTTVLQSFLINSEVGSDCRIGPFAHLRDGSLLADAVRVGNFVELKNCSVGSETNVAHLSYVGDAEVGSQANIGAGTITANYDHITKVKARTIIGDGASTGSNSVLVAPITVGNQASVAAGTVATRDVPDGALAVGRARQENKEGWVDSRKRRSRGDAVHRPV